MEKFSQRLPTAYNVHGRPTTKANDFMAVKSGRISSHHEHAASLGRHDVARPLSPGTDRSRACRRGHTSPRWAGSRTR